MCPPLSLCWPLWWRRGFTHPLEPSLGLPLHQSCVAEEGPQSTVVLPDGEGAQNILQSLGSSSCLNSPPYTSNSRSHRTFTLFAVTFPKSPVLFLLSMVFCLLIPKLGSLLSCDIYTVQSWLFHSSAPYFEWKELLQRDYLAGKGAAGAEIMFLLSPILGVAQMLVLSTKRCSARDGKLFRQCWGRGALLCCPCLLLWTLVCKQEVTLKSFMIVLPACC